MAKKKLIHHQEPETQKTHHEESATFSNIAAMDEASEKLHNLKSLNARLLKETVERRREVEELLKAKGSLESELTRSNSEKERLMTELTRLGERAESLEVEKSVMAVFVAQQVKVIERERDEIEKKVKSFEREMGEILREKCEIEEVKNEKESEIELLSKKLDGIAVEVKKEKGFSNGVCLERDEIRAKLDIQIKEANELGRKLIEVEKREKLVQEECEKLRSECNGLVKQKKEKERQIEGMMRDKELVEKSLMEANKAIEEMKREIDGILKEKEGIEEERNREVRKRSKLENVVSVLNEIVGSLRKEEERLRVNVAELERRCVEAEEKEQEMCREIDALVKEKSESERAFFRLTEKKGMVEKDLVEALKQLDEHKKKMEHIVKEKSDIAVAKVTKESEVVELEKQVVNLRDAILGLEESCRVQKVKINSLESNVAKFKDSFDQVSIERDEARKGFEEEKHNGAMLKKKIMEMEKNVEETAKLVEKMKAENANFTGEKENLESRCNILKKEIASAENELAETRKELQAVKDKLEAAGTNSEQIFKVLRSTAELICAKNEVDVAGGAVLANKEMKGEAEPYLAELEAIKNAFESRENKVEDMKRQLEFLENSVVEAHKKKSFWTLISSATTLFAAISLAYIARGH